MKDNNGVSIEKLDLSVRAFNCSKRSGINTIDDILKFDEEICFHQIRNLDERCKNEIIDKIHGCGLKFKWDENYNENQNKLILSKLGEEDNIKQIEQELKQMHIIDLGFDYTIITWCEKKQYKYIYELLRSDLENDKDLTDENKRKIIDKIHSLGLRFNYEIKNDMINEKSAILLEYQNKKMKEQNARNRILIQDCKKLLMEKEILNEEAQELYANIQRLLENEFEIPGKKL